jgi:hypothetical protein
LRFCTQRHNRTFMQLRRTLHNFLQGLKPDEDTPVYADAEAPAS